MRKAQRISYEDVTNVSSATVKELETFEAVRLEMGKRNDSAESVFRQPFSPYSEPKKGAPLQQTAHGLDVEAPAFGTSGEGSRPFLSNKTATLLVTACVLAALSAYFFGQMSANKRAVSSVTSMTHSEGGDPSTAHAGAVLAEGSLQSVERVDEEAAVLGADALPSSDDPNIQLLDMQQLLNGSRKSASGIEGGQSGASLASDAAGSALGTLSDTTAEAAADASSAPQSEF